MSKKPKIAFNNAGYIKKGEDISNIIANLSTATNNIIINGLMRRGFSEIYQFNSSSVKLDEINVPVARVVKLKLIEKNCRKNKKEIKPLKYGNSACSYSGMFQMTLDEFAIIFIRGDDIDTNPNFLEIFESAQRPLYINSPKRTMETLDKFEIKKRAEKDGIKIPKTMNVIDFQEMLGCLKEIFGRYKVIKARFGFGGKEVWRVTSGTPEKELRKIFGMCPGGAVLQEYKEIIERGDLRLNVFDGEVLGNRALLRQASRGKWKTNIDLGGSHSPYEIDEKIIKTASKVSEAYAEVRLHGVDLFLDGTFIETNAYPTTLGYLHNHFGFKAEEVILDKLLEEINCLLPFSSI